MRRLITAARLAVSVAVIALAAGCAAGATFPPTGTPVPSPAFVASPAAPSTTPTAAGTATSAPVVTGWPTVASAGVTLTGRLVEEGPPFEGCPAPVPAVTLAVTITGLVPGDTVLIDGIGDYAFGTLGCGVQPSPCEWGSGTTDPTVHLCRPEYAQPAKGTAVTARQATAKIDGTASATLRFVVLQSERPCPAGSSRPWYVESGTWNLEVNDKAHGLRLVIGHPDLVIGP